MKYILLLCLLIAVSAYAGSACIEQDTINQRTINIDREITKSEIELLKKLEGVENVYNWTRYAVIVQKGKAFYWADIFPGIAAVLDLPDDIWFCDEQEQIKSEKFKI